MFYYQKGHIGIRLIQLELLSLYVLYTLFFGVWGASSKPIILFLMLCVLVREAALGMCFLVITRRQVSTSLEKFSL